MSTSPGRAAAVAVGVVYRSALLCCACVCMYVRSYSMSAEVGAVDM